LCSVDSVGQALVEALEAVNPTPRPLEHPSLLTGTWRLIYTTSDSILGTGRLRILRPKYSRILQSINAATLEAKNEEWVLQGLLRNSVKADLIPRDDGRTVTVQFKRFGIGWLGFPAPKSAVRRFPGVMWICQVPTTLHANPEGLFTSCQFITLAGQVGVLETTYLDDELRISRGDKGNLFVLVKQGPPRV
jgi:hypothetical protein